MSEDNESQPERTDVRSYRLVQMAGVEFMAAILPAMMASGSRGIRNREVCRSHGIDHGYPNNGGGEVHRGHESSVLLHEFPVKGSWSSSTVAGSQWEKFDECRSY